MGTVNLLASLREGKTVGPRSKEELMDVIEQKGIEIQESLTTLRNYK